MKQAINFISLNKIGFITCLYSNYFNFAEVNPGLLCLKNGLAKLVIDYSSLNKKIKI